MSVPHPHPSGRDRHSRGYTRGEFDAGAIPWAELTPPEYRHLDAAAVRCPPFEKDYVRKDGSRVPVLVGGAALGGDGAGVAFVLDRTGRRRAEAELRLRDRAIQAVSQGILISDPTRPDNPVVYVSPGFERLTGYPAAEVVGRNPRFLPGPDTDPAAVARVRGAVRAGEPCTVERLNYRNDGTPFWNQLSISPARDPAGRVTHFVGVQADVTDRRRLEEQYRQAQKMEAVGRLAGGSPTTSTTCSPSSTGSPTCWPGCWRGTTTPAPWPTRSARPGGGRPGKTARSGPVGVRSRRQANPGNPCACRRSRSTCLPNRSDVAVRLTARRPPAV